MPSVDAVTAAVLRAWRLMGNSINWAALPIVAELIGFEDIERLIQGLLVIQDPSDAQAPN